MNILLAVLVGGPLAVAEPPRRSVYALTADLPGLLLEREVRACSERSLLLLDGGLDFEADLPLGGGTRTLVLGGGLGLGRVVQAESPVPEEDDVWHMSFPTTAGWRRYLDTGGPLPDGFGWPKGESYNPFLALRAGWALGLVRGGRRDVGPLVRVSAGVDLGEGEVLGRVELSLEVRTSISGGRIQYSMFCSGECPCIDDPLGASGLWLGVSVGAVGTGDVWRDVLVP